MAAQSQTQVSADLPQGQERSSERQGGVAAAAAVYPQADEPADASAEARGPVAHAYRLEGRVREVFTPPARTVLFVGFVLCACAGMVNVIAFLELQAFVSHVTGTTSRIGMRLQGVIVGTATAEALLKSVGLVASFVGGAALCGLSAGRDDLNEVHVGKKLYGLALLGVSALLLGAMALSDTSADAAAFMAAAACGLQNGMCTMHFGSIVRTTHVTGLATDLGTHFGRWLAVLFRSSFFTKLDAFDRAEKEVVSKKLSVYLLLGAGFLLGSFIGAWLVDWMKVLAFLVPASITALIGCVYLCLREKLRQRYFAGTDAEKLRAEGKACEVHHILKRTQRYMQEAQLAVPNDMELQHLSEILAAIEAKVAARYPMKALI